MDAELPRNWTLRPVGSLVREGRPICYGVLKPGRFQSRGIPLVRIVDIEGDALASRGLYRISKTLDAEFARSRLSGGEILVSIQGTVGRVALAPKDLRGANISRTIARIDIVETISAEYVRHWMLSHQGQRAFDEAIVGTTRSSLNIGVLRRIQVPLPPPTEQRRIAEILDTLDEAIRKTEQVIAKLQQMKQGLLHDLLTRGIDENGELRDPVRHPEQFKESVLGRIPREWEVDVVDNLLGEVEPAMRSGPFGSALLKEELVGSGVPLLGIDNVYAERFERHCTRFVSPQKASELSRYLVRPKDVMITIMGTVGRCALVPDDIGEALSSKHVWTLTFDQSRYVPYLACLQFNYAPWVLAHFGRDVQGGIMSAIRSETIRSAPIPVPSLGEQFVIKSILVDLDHRIKSELLDADKLRTLKQGLMDDLLTGSVRVSEPEESAA